MQVWSSLVIVTICSHVFSWLASVVFCMDSLFAAYLMIRCLFIVLV